MIVVIKTKDELKEYVKQQTKIAREEVSGEQKKEPVIVEESKLTKDLKEVMESEDFGCYTSKVQDLLKAIIKHCTGEDVEFEENSDDEDKEKFYSYKKFEAIVPLQDLRDHNYPLNKVAIVTQEDDGSQENRDGLLNIDGDEGNTLYGKWRHATDQEIDDFFNSKKIIKVKDKDILKFF